METDNLWFSKHKKNKMEYFIRDFHVQRIKNHLF